MNQTKKQFLQLAGYVVIFMLLIAFSHLINLLLLFGNSLGDELGGLLDTEIINDLSFAFFVLTFYSFFHIALYYNLSQKQSCILEKNTFPNRVRRVITLPLFWIELALILLFLFVLPTTFLLIPKQIKIASYFVFGFSFFLVQLSVVKQWNYERNKKKIHPIEILKAVGVRIVLFSLGAIATPAVVGTAYSIFHIFFSLIWSIAIPIVLLSLLLFLFFFRYFRAFSKRKKMMQKLKQICEEKQYSFSQCKVFRSVLFSHPGPEITIRTENNIYECKLLCSLSRKTPMFLSPNGEAAIVHSIKIGRISLFHFTNITQYSFQSNNIKILILVPISRDVYETNGNRPFQLDEGYKIKDYAVYSSSAFLNALEREVIK